LIRLSKQLIRVDRSSNTTAFDGAKVSSEISKECSKLSSVHSKPVQDNLSVFKKPSIPNQSQKVSLGKPNDQLKSLNEDVDMKSATSVCSMDFNVVDLTHSQDQQVPSSKSIPPSIPKHDAAEKSTAGSKSTSQPIITVQVVHDSVVDLTGDDDEEKPKEDTKKQPIKPKKESEKPQKKKKTTISEDTKMKIRDSIFASMLAKQKGMLEQ